MTETMTVSEIITAASGLVSDFSVVIWISAIIGAGTMLLRRVRSAAK